MGRELIYRKSRCNYYRCTRMFFLGYVRGYVRASERVIQCTGEHVSLIYSIFIPITITWSILTIFHVSCGNIIIPHRVVNRVMLTMSRFRPPPLSLVMWASIITHIVETSVGFSLLFFSFVIRFVNNCSIFRYDIGVPVAMFLPMHVFLSYSHGCTILGLTSTVWK